MGRTMAFWRGQGGSRTAPTGGDEKARTCIQGVRLLVNLRGLRQRRMFHIRLWFVGWGYGSQAGPFVYGERGVGAPFGAPTPRATGRSSLLEEREEVKGWIPARRPE